LYFFVLEKESSILIEWFNINCIQANPDTFQAIAVGKKTYATEPVLNIAWLLNKHAKPMHKN
jgi:hypothetical protein